MIDKEVLKLTIYSMITEEYTKIQKRKIVGLLFTYDAPNAGELFYIYEGINNICSPKAIDDYEYANDSPDKIYDDIHIDYYGTDVDSVHAIIYSDVFGFQLNGKELKTNDIISIGATKLIFFSIPKDF